MPDDADKWLEELRKAREESEGIDMSKMREAMAFGIDSGIRRYLELAERDLTAQVSTVEVAFMCEVSGAIWTELMDKVAEGAFNVEKTEDTGPRDSGDERE